MNTARQIKTTTALRNALLRIGLTDRDIKDVVSRMKSNTEGTERFTVTHHVDGFVPNSYRYRAPGTRYVVTVEGAGFSVATETYDRKRPHGVGQRLMVRAANGAQVHGSAI